MNFIQNLREKTYCFIKINIYVFCLYFKYPLLGKFWDTYNEFDKTVEGDRYNHWYKAFFDPFMDGLGDHNKEHKNFCLKLVRNLGRYSSPGDPYFNPNNDRCRILYYWIYNSARKHEISDEIITECFQDYIDFMSETCTGYRCSYNSYDDMYEEPMNIIILDIFQSNMNVIENKLDGRYASINFPLQMYICECIEIFKKMYKKYCPKVDADSEKRKRTCDMLESIKTTYNSFISGKLYQNNKLPSLDNDGREYLAMCPQDNPSLKLTPIGHEALSVSAPLNGMKSGDTAGVSPYEGAMDFGRYSFTPFTGVDGENQVNTMSRTVSTAVGTVAGASSVLALLYRVNKEFHLNV
ncbi:hypothetical protein PVNG_03818 [Plasmodium vivax North Korean]|uniref:Uncharacterized protein n=1 Tax=Plasmodium vivax North Korean TaxID=1035514 RepID=A0A0J9TTT4_PLAVI|nr:hypothetical protein PVNG_03818 [Plasmodium vivax North Korean]